MNVSNLTGISPIGHIYLKVYFEIFRKHYHVQISPTAKWKNDKTRKFCNKSIQFYSVKVFVCIYVNIGHAYKPIEC